VGAATVLKTEVIAQNLERCDRRHGKLARAPRARAILRVHVRHAVRGLPDAVIPLLMANISLLNPRSTLARRGGRVQRAAFEAPA
jgi:hypothetical protein